MGDRCLGKHVLGGAPLGLQVLGVGLLVEPFLDVGQGDLGDGALGGQFLVVCKGVRLPGSPVPVVSLLCAWFGSRPLLGLRIMLLCVTVELVLGVGRLSEWGLCGGLLGWPVLVVCDSIVCRAATLLLSQCLVLAKTSTALCHRRAVGVELLNVGPNPYVHMG